MKTQQHTAGPWRVDEIADGSSSGKDDGQSLPIVVGKGGTIAAVKACANPRLACGDANLSDLGDVRGCEGWPLGRRIAFANARLIASAPDLYNALKALMDLNPFHDRSDVAELRAINLARAALTKAEGGAS